MNILDYFTVEIYGTCSNFTLLFKFMNNVPTCVDEHRKLSETSTYDSQLEGHRKLA